MRKADIRIRTIVILISVMIIMPLLSECTELWVEPGEMKELRRCGDGVLYEVDAPYGPLLVARVSGTHYEMGRQYGCLVGDKIMGLMMIYTQSKTPRQVKNSLFFRMFTKVWKMLAPHVPQEYKEEMQGISDGAKEAGFFAPRALLEAGVGVTNFSDMYDKSAIYAELKKELDEKESEYAIRMLEDFSFRTTCSSFAAWGSRTAGGRMFGTRDLDWEANRGINRFSIVTAYEPETEDGTKLNRYVTAGYTGLVGALDGLNEKGIMLGEIGAVNAAETQEGVPWTIKFRMVLERANDLEEAVTILKSTKNTVGYNFVIGYGDVDNYGTDTFSPAAAAVEQNGLYTAVFHDNAPAEAAAVWIDAEGNPVLENGEKVRYGFPLPEAVYRADPAMAPAIRRTQVSGNGPGKPEHNGDPRNAGSYKKRYIPHYQMLKALEEGAEFSFRDRVVFPASDAPTPVGPEESMKILDVVSMKGSNIIAVVYDATGLKLWVAYESGHGESWKPASDNPYVQFDFKTLFE